MGLGSSGLVGGVVEVGIVVGVAMVGMATMRGMMSLGRSLASNR